MKVLSLFLLLFVLPVPTNAQKPLKTGSDKAIRFYEEGTQHYRYKNYGQAEENLRNSIKADTGFQNAYLVLAEVYWEQGKYDSAIVFYGKGLAIDPKFYIQGYLNKGNLEIKVGRYSHALASYKKFLSFDSIPEKYLPQAKHGVLQAKFGIHALANPVNFAPINLGHNVNTHEDEYWPALSADEQTLVITRLIHTQSFPFQVQEDLYFSTKSESGWSEMKAAGYPLNTPDNEGAQSISANGKLMVYTVCNREGVIGRCDIYFAIKEGDKWTTPKNMGAPVNTIAKETQPSLSADGKQIYFACDRRGGYGGLDIWMSSQNDEGRWSEPVNLGDSVNSQGDELSPFIHPDNNTLYFSSDYKIGMGGADIFIARRDEKGKWSHVENLGYPINTQSDEIGLIVNAKGNKAYYSSGIDKEWGKDIFEFDLYKEARPTEVSYMKGVVFDENSLSRLKARFELYDLSNGNRISQAVSDERTGEFLLCIPADKNYMLNVERAGYLFYSDNFSLKGVFHVDKPFLKDVPLKPIAAGGKIVLNNIFFETDSYSLKPESGYELDKVVRFMNLNKNVHIQISGHTDNVGTQSYNQTLSHNRARSVIEYLTKQGIDTARLTSKGYGFSVPIESNETPEGRAKNRRTELEVITNIQ